MSESYEDKAKHELALWKKKITVRPGVFMRLSKQTQSVINQKIPAKVHETITASIKAMTEAVLTGAAQFNKEEFSPFLTLEEREKRAVKLLEAHRNTAVLEGAGTGAGGVILGMADFPLLLSIKMKYIFSLCQLYGFNPSHFEERAYMLLIFQLAFSSSEKKEEVLAIMEKWEKDTRYHKQMDWQSFQQEYRDSIDLVKMLQLVPGVGAVVGAWANYHLLEHLGETAKQAYRMRWFHKEEC